ncbi:hypothetical protein BH23GEM7_BH23GEM7_21610 [soil metagenome]
MRVSAPGVSVLAAALLLTLGACERRDEQRAAAELPGDTTASAVAEADAEMMQRHASEANVVVREVREHINFMWRLPPREVPAHAGMHASHVEALVETIERQTREMDAGVGMDEERRGEMMGIRADQYRLLREEMQLARAEAGELQNASEAEVRERLRGHLDRLARIVETLEASAAHMGRVGAEAAAP